MKTPGYKITCDGKGCKASEFFETDEDWRDADWYPHPDYPDTRHLCDDCWNSQENTRDEQAKLSQAEEIEFDSRHPYTSAIRDSLNNGGGIKCQE